MTANETEKNETLPKKSYKGQLGGARPGAGMPKGKKLPRTLEREAMLKAIRERIVKDSHRLLDAQYSIALGQQFLFKIPKGKDDPVLVKDEEEIRSFLRGEFDNNEDGHYFITTKEPDNRALDSLLNRTYGKATDHIDIKSGGEPIGAIQYIIPKDPDGSQNNNP